MSAEDEGLGPMLELVKAGRRLELRAVVRWLEDRATEYDSHTRLALLRLARRLVKNEHWEV